MSGRPFPSAVCDLRSACKGGHRRRRLERGTHDVGGCGRHDQLTIRVATELGICRGDGDDCLVDRFESVRIRQVAFDINEAAPLAARRKLTLESFDRLHHTGVRCKEVFQLESRLDIEGRHQAKRTDYEHDWNRDGPTCSQASHEGAGRSQAMGGAFHLIADLTLCCDCLPVAAAGCPHQEGDEQPVHERDGGHAELRHHRAQSHGKT